MNNAITLAELDLKYEITEEYAINTPETESYLENLKRINKLPFNKGDIYYSDSIWDFSPYTTLNVSRTKMKFNFQRVNEEFQDDTKNYVLVKILENKNKVQSINRSFGVICRFFNHVRKYNYYHVKDISLETMHSFLKQEEQKSEFALRRAKTVIKDFFSFYAANFEDLLSKEMQQTLNLGDYRLFKAIREQNKSADIPQKYFDNLIKLILQIIDSEDVPLRYRATACVYLILSQTGLRIGEILGLETDCLQTTKIFNGEETNYIKYRTWKRVNGNNTCTTERTYVNELTKKAYETLMKLHQEKRDLLGLDYLYMGGQKMNKPSQFPVSPDSFSKQQIPFFAYIDRYMPTINLPDDKYPELLRIKVDKNKAVLGLNPEAKTLTYPKNPQFRVHVCTELYNKGVPLKYIQKFMGHLSTEMQGYYVRPKNNLQEDMEFTLETLEKVVSGEIRLLGGSNGLSEKIQEFITENNYNVEKDIKTICEKLAAKIPIRQKTGGVCIKSSMLRECSKDAKTNEFYCAYGVCPNIFHFYYMADVSFRQTQELVETIHINKSRGHLRQAQKEVNMLNTIISNKLLPELNELKVMITKKGVLPVLEEYPDLKDIIENLDAIYEDVSAWKSMTLLNQS